MKHRWASALALSAALVSGALVAVTTSPATAGPAYKYTSYHNLAPSMWELVSFDCTQVPDDATTLKLARFGIQTRGAGSLQVSSDASYGGALLTSDRPGLASLVYPTYVEGDHPKGRWRVEVGEHVLESDPVPLDPGVWTMAAIDGVVLHEGDWSGTATDFQDQFGVADTYTAGLMTGGCLGSPTAYVDTVTRQRNHKIVRDLEPSMWASLEWNDLNGGLLTYGDHLRVRTRLVRESLTGDHVYGIVSARMELWRQLVHAKWKKLTTVRTDGLGKAQVTVAARRTARFQWRRADRTAVSDKVLIRTYSTSAR